MTTTDLAKLTQTIKYGARTFVHVRPGIVAAYYSVAPLPVLCARIADAIEAYAKLVGRPALGHYLAASGEKEPLTDKRLERDLKRLRNLPKSAGALDLAYSSEPDADVGEYAITVMASEEDEDFEEQASLVRFEFGHDALERLGEAPLLQFVHAQAARLQALSGNVGLGFKRGTGFDDEATAAINAMLPRYLAIDPCFDGMAELMRGHTPAAHWINILDKELFAKCGGEKALAKSAAGVQLTKVDDVVALRASRVPPVGDRNRQAKDLGCLPGVAKFLKPTRVPLDGMGDDEFDAEAWMERFDELTSRDWNNA